MQNKSSKKFLGSHFFLCRAPLREHVSQADGLLLWWMYTYWGPIRGLERGLFRLIPAPQSFSVLCGFHTGGVTHKLSFPPLCTGQKGRGFKPCDRQKFFQLKFWNLKVDVLSRHANFPISLPPHTTCSCYLEPSFCSSFFL